MEKGEKGIPGKEMSINRDAELGILLRTQRILGRSRWCMKSGATISKKLYSLKMCDHGVLHTILRSLELVW